MYIIFIDNGYANASVFHRVGGTRSVFTMNCSSLFRWDFYLATNDVNIVSNRFSFCSLTTRAHSPNWHICRSEQCIHRQRFSKRFHCLCAGILNCSPPKSLVHTAQSANWLWRTSHVQIVYSHSIHTYTSNRTLTGVSAQLFSVFVLFTKIASIDKPLPTMEWTRSKWKLKMVCHCALSYYIPK